MKKTLTLLLAMSIASFANAQTGTAINDNGASPDPSSILDVQSASKGLLIPKMTLSQRNAIVGPADGLMIYQTDGLKGIYHYDASNGGAWYKSSSKWSDQPSTPGAIFYKPQNIAFPKIGIGLENPVTYLDVAGSVRIGANEFGVTANNPPINGLLVGGPVGIGSDVAAPAMLTIGGVGGVAAMGVGNGHYFLAKNISGQYETWMVPRSNPSSQTLMYFGSGGMNLQNNNSVSAFYITPGGNIGLSNTNPVYKLDVAGDVNLSAASKVRLNTTPVLYGSSSSIEANIRFLRNDGIGGNADGLHINHNSAGGNSAHVRFYANGTTERMIINANTGNVGIGDSNPFNRLTVNGNSNITGRLSLGQNSTNNNNVFTANGNSDVSGKLSLGLVSTNNNNRLTVSGNSDFTGNVGIGVTNPGTKLDINAGTSQVRIIAAGNGGGQLSYGAYPLSIEGANQGIIIKVNTSTPTNDNNFLTMIGGNNTAVGAIEGETYGELTSSAEYVWNTVMSSITLVFEAALFIADLAGIDDPDAAAVEAVNMPLQAGQFVFEQLMMEDKVGVSFTSGGADYAEWLQRKDENEIIRAGDVVGVIGGKITKKTTNAQQMMVVSTAPLVLGNQPKEEDEKYYEKVAFLGQVMVKTFGKVSVGDFIVASGMNDGIAKGIHPDKMTTDDYQNIVGVAWSSNEFNSPSLINTLIGKSSFEAMGLIKKKDNEIAALQKQVDELSGFLAAKFPDFKSNNTTPSTLASNANALETSAANNFEESPAMQKMLTTGKIDFNSIKNNLIENKEKSRKLLNIAKTRCEKLGVDFTKYPEMLKLFDPNELEKTIESLDATQN